MLGELTETATRGAVKVRRQERTYASDRSPRQVAGVRVSICTKLGCQDLLADCVEACEGEREMWLTGFDRSWFGKQGAGLGGRIQRSVCTR